MTLLRGIFNQCEVAFHNALWTAQDIALHDLSGRQVYHKAEAAGPVVIIPIDRLSRGTYCVRVYDTVLSRNKLLIIQ